MPHIIFNTVAGKSKAQIEAACIAARDAISKVLGKPEYLFSVAVNEYPLSDWEGYYNDNIKDNNNVVIKPGYSNPRTFEKD